jgi:hypothetical protein
LIDLRFADSDSTKTMDCSKCPSSLRKQRKCEQDGLNNLDRPISVDSYGLKLTFCPAKATWYHEFTELFSQLLVALETGILPKGGNLEDQDQLFVELFPYFVDRYRARQYSRSWADVITFAPKVLEAIGKMISRMFGGK